MESVGLNMEDLFEIGDGDDDIGATTAPMPDLESDMPPMDEQTEENEGEPDSDVLAKLKDIKGGAAKKRVLRPQPKLDPARLNGDRGLPLIVNTFQGVKFKGKGYEADDLKVMMNKLEHWAHRLFPKMTFDEVIARIEKLGMKREVQTTLKRIRLDMPIADEDFVSEPTETNENDEFGANNFHEEDIMDAEAAYDEMVRQEREAMGKLQQEEENTEIQNEFSQRENIFKSPPPSTPKTDNFTPNTPVNQSAAPSQGMTPEQKERLEKNKLRALEKRAARLGVPVSALLPPTPKPSTEAQSPDKNPENSQDSPVTNTSDNVSVKTRTNEQGSVNSESTPAESKQGAETIEDKECTDNFQDEIMLTEEELLSTIDIDNVGKDIDDNNGDSKEIEIGDINDINRNKENQEIEKINACSEPMLDSVQFDVDTNPTGSNEMESSPEEISINLNLETQDTVNTESNTFKSPEQDSNKEESVQTEKDENDSRKGSIEGEDLQLRLSESDTTNTTQEEDEIEKDLSHTNMDVS